MSTVSPTSTCNSREQGKGALFTAGTPKTVNDLSGSGGLSQRWVFIRECSLSGNVLSAPGSQCLQTHHGHLIFEQRHTGKQKWCLWALVPSTHPAVHGKACWGVSSHFRLLPPNAKVLWLCCEAQNRSDGSLSQPRQLGQPQYSAKELFPCVGLLNVPLAGGSLRVWAAAGCVTALLGTACTPLSSTDTASVPPWSEEQVMLIFIYHLIKPFNIVKVKTCFNSSSGKGCVLLFHSSMSVLLVS